MVEDDRQRRERLPAAVYDLAVRLGADPAMNRLVVTLRQTGRMKRKLGDRSWMSFAATQTISTDACAFDWRARFGPFGMVSARDALTDGAARFEVMALGFIPVAGAKPSPALTRGELMRYLAELAWAPDAILLNSALRWREEGPQRLAVSAGIGETAAEIMLDLDGDGRIVDTFAPDRPRSTAGLPLLTPWRGRFSDYRHHDGLWLPFAGEVAWEIDGTEEIYWQGRIEHWEAPCVAVRTLPGSTVAPLQWRP